MTELDKDVQEIIDIWVRNAYSAKVPFEEIKAVLQKREGVLRKALERHHNYRLAEEASYPDCGLFKETEAALKSIKE